MIDKNALFEFAKTFGIDISEDTANYFDLLAERLVEKNKDYNLTSLLEPDEILNKHIIDSLTAVPIILTTGESGKVIDVGTGAGFPGLIISAVLPKFEFTLLDSSEKKVNYITETVRLNKSIFECVPKAICSRAEDLARDDKYREKFDAVISRAVASLNSLSELCVPLIKTGGHFIAMKGKNADEEIAEAENAITELSIKLANKYCFTLPDGSERQILDFVKTAPTIEKYPRRAAAIKKRPL